MISRNRYNKKTNNKLMSEINVTPFVDVMLVLLIVFMITAPLLKTGVEIELPEVDTPNISEKKDPLPDHTSLPMFAPGFQKSNNRN